MTKMKTILALLLSATLFSYAFAEDPDRIDRGYDREIQTPAPIQTDADPAIGEKVVTVLDDRIIEVDEEYALQLETLNAQVLAAANYREEMLLSRQVEALKLEWSLAVSEVQLQIARENGDTGTEAEILHAIDYIQNPPQRKLQQVHRDPNTGEVLDGGAR